MDNEGNVIDQLLELQSGLRVAADILDRADPQWGR